MNYDPLLNIHFFPLYLGTGLPFLVLNCSVPLNHGIPDNSTHPILNRCSKLWPCLSFVTDSSSSPSSFSMFKWKKKEPKPAEKWSEEQRQRQQKVVEVRQQRPPPPNLVQLANTVSLYWEAVNSHSIEKGTICVPYKVFYCEKAPFSILGAHSSAKCHAALKSGVCRISTLDFFIRLKVTWIGCHCHYCSYYKKRQQKNLVFAPIAGEKRAVQFHSILESIIWSDFLYLVQKP